jgi:competence protein ComEC
VGWLSGAVSRLRQVARETLARWTPPGPASGVVRAMVLGDRAGLEPEIEEAFRIAGTYHVLALSGAQVALVVGLMLWPLRRLGLAPGLTAAVVGSGVLFYATFVGGEIPVLRAAVMALVLLVGLAFGFEGDAANLLGLAGLALLAHHPSSVGDVAFQLSFVATLAIITLVPVLAPFSRRLPSGVGLLVTASLAAQIGVTPLLALHFHRLAPAALVLNLAAVPLASVVLVAGFGVVLTASWAPPLAWFSALVAERSAALMLWSGELVRLAPWLDVRVPTPGIGLLLLYGAAAVTLARETRVRRAPVLLLGAAVVGLVLGSGPPLGDGRLALTVLDVGDGDSLVVRSPAGRVLLVDAGGSRWPSIDTGEAVTAPFLWQQGRRRVDALVLTHSHNDHVGGAPFLVSAFRPEEVWEAPRVAGQALPDAVAAAVSRAGVVRTTVCRGMRRRWDEVDIEVLWPACESSARSGPENDASVVLRLRHKGITFLLSGDAGASVEGLIEPGRAEVVKVPHHGSRSSSSDAFVAEVRPRLAIVSCGRRREADAALAGVVERYRRAGARVERTDRGGAVTVASDGRRLWVDTFR